VWTSVYQNEILLITFKISVGHSIPQVVTSFPLQWPGLDPSQVMWDLWWTKWHRGWFSLSTSVSLALSHSTSCSIFVYHLDTTMVCIPSGISVIPPHTGKKFYQNSWNNYNSLVLPAITLDLIVKERPNKHYCLSDYVTIIKNNKYTTPFEKCSYINLFHHMHFTFSDTHSQRSFLFKCSVLQQVIS
jgi:hypothetical protein